MGLSARLRLAKLALVVDTRRDTGDLARVVTAALRGGVDMVELRDRHASADEVAAAWEVVRDATDQVPSALAVLGLAPQVARQAAVDVVHLGAVEGPVAQARRVVGEFGLVGRSVHHREDFGHIEADFLVLGPVVSDLPGAPGLDIVTDAAQRLPVTDVTATPWFAIGGITADTLGPVLDAGAIRVAVSTAISDADDPEAAARELKARVQAAWDARPGMERYVLSALGGGTARFLDQGDR